MYRYELNFAGYLHYKRLSASTKARALRARANSMVGRFVVLSYSISPGSGSVIQRTGPQPDQVQRITVAQRDVRFTLGCFRHDVHR